VKLLHSVTLSPLPGVSRDCAGDAQEPVAQGVDPGVELCQLPLLIVTKSVAYAEAPKSRQSNAMRLIGSPPDDALLLQPVQLF
jgi:hypothetical protein